MVIKKQQYIIPEMAKLFKMGSNKIFQLGNQTLPFEEFNLTLSS